MTITLADGTTRTLTATGGHPFWVEDGESLASRPLALEHAGEADGRYTSPTGGRWVEARHLSLGDRLLAHEFESATVTGLWLRTERLWVYNLVVGGLRCYAVGHAGVLVHNACPNQGPRPNEGDARPHGAGDHNEALDNRLQRAKEEGGTNVRKNQQQVDADGNKMGTNRPDGQWDDPDGVHHNYEVDRTRSSSDAHRNTIENNDPNSQNEYDLLD